MSELENLIEPTVNGDTKELYPIAAPELKYDPETLGYSPVKTIEAAYIGPPPPTQFIPSDEGRGRLGVPLSGPIPNISLNPLSHSINNVSKKPTTTADWLLSNQFKKSLLEILPKNLTPERICRIALNELRKNPRLQECSAQSFLGAVMNATTLGLEVGDVLGHAYLIPRKGICQMHIGYKGMLELGKRAGVLITTNLVYPGDEFYAEYGNEEKLKHIIKPHHMSNYISVYAYLRTKENKFKMEIMSPEEINKIRERSPSGHKPDSPWVNDFNAMAKKTVVRQLFKYMPISNEITKAVALDEQAELGIQDNNFQIEEE